MGRRREARKQARSDRREKKRDKRAARKERRMQMRQNTRLQKAQIQADADVQKSANQADADKTAYENGVQPYQSSSNSGGTTGDKIGGALGNFVGGIFGTNKGGGNDSSDAGMSDAYAQAAQAETSGMADMFGGASGKKGIAGFLSNPVMLLVTIGGVFAVFQMMKNGNKGKGSNRYR